MAYDCFISYSHAADGQLAPALQRGLQRLARAWNQRRALHVFRDDSGLAVNPHLWASIASAMDDSKWFVLLASPDAAASPWVSREIEHWLTRKPADQILPVLTDGTLVWNSTIGDYDRATSTALPVALFGTFADEPRHLDLRWAREETELDLRHSKFREAVADLAAPMHGIAKEDLESEDVRRHRRAIGLARTVALCLVVLTMAAAITSGFAFIQRTRANRKAIESAALVLAERSGDRRDNHLDTALLLAVEAQHRNDSPSTRKALLAAVGHYPRLVAFHNLQGASASSTAAFIPHSNLVALGRPDGSVGIVDYATGVSRVNIPPAFDGMAGLSASPDGRLLATLAEDGEARLWDASSGRLITEFQTADAPINIKPSMAFSPGGDRLATTVTDGRMRIWSLPSGRLQVEAGSAPTSGDPGIPVGLGRAIAFAPDGRTLAVGVGHSRLTFFDAGSGRLLGDRFLTGLEGVVLNEGAVYNAVLTCGAFGPDGQLGVCVNFNSSPAGTAVQLMGNQVMGPFGQAAAVSSPVIGLAGHATAVGFDSNFDFYVAGDDGRILEVDHHDGTIRLVVGAGAAVSDLFVGEGRVLAATGQGVTESGGYGQRGIPLVHACPGLVSCAVKDLSVSLDGRSVAATTELSGVRLLDTRTRRFAASPISDARAPSAVSYGPTRDLITLAATSAANPAKTDVIIWNLADRRRVKTIPINSSIVGDLQLSRDRKTVAALVGERGANGRVMVWSATSHRNQSELVGPSSGVVAFAFDGASLATRMADGTVSLWTPVRGRPTRLTRLVDPELFTGFQPPLLALSATGDLLAAAIDGGVQLWDSKSGKPVGSPLLTGSGGSTSLIDGVAFSADGRSLVASSVAGTITLWDVGTGERVAEVGEGAVGFPTGGGLAMVGDHQVVTAGQAGMALWDFAPSSLRTRACRLAGRNLTYREWSTLVGGAYRRTCPQWPRGGGTR